LHDKLWLEEQSCASAASCGLPVSRIVATQLRYRDRGSGELLPLGGPIRPLRAAQAANRKSACRRASRSRCPLKRAGLAADPSGGAGANGNRLEGAAVTRTERTENATAAALRIEDLRPAAAQLSAQEFEEQCGSAFLLLSSTGFRQSKSATSTEVLLLDADEVGERTAGVSVRIIPIRVSKNSLAHLITIGRTAKNDVMISDISVSRFHAFFKRGSTGGFQLQDAGSTNGTLVNGASVCTKEAGPPTNVKSGDNIRFGQVDVTFLDVDAMRSYLAKFGD
jgi:hypothetical protein